MPDERAQSDVTMRLALASDAPEIARLLTELGHPTSALEVGARWSTWARAGNSAWVAALSNDALGGIVTLHVTHVLHRPRPVGRITALFVDSLQRGRGLGRQLVARAEADLARAGCGLLEITSNLRRSDAHAFYEHLGYERTSARFARPIASSDQHVT